LDAYFVKREQLTAEIKLQKSPTVQNAPSWKTTLSFAFTAGNLRTSFARIARLPHIAARSAKKRMP
jgi:hypothetical protein